jgi:hypothetical protein
MSVQVTVCNTAQLLRMADNAKGRNRAADIETLRKSIDPGGTHLLNMSMVHNDVELRTWWLVKRSSSMQPVDLWLDVDFEVFQEHTETKECPDGPV